MEQISYYSTVISLTLVILTWLVFAAAFLIRKKPESTPEAKSAPKSLFGIFLQGIGFALVWAFRRSPVFSPTIDGQFLLNIILQIFAVLVAAGSVWLAVSAIRELGRQWSLSARLIEQHRLITSGVYRIVRHPIYTAMFGMMIATGIIFSRWYVIPAAIVVFLIGTKIRTVSEENLLRGAFPDEYKNYAQKVPALVPFVRFF